MRAFSRLTTAACVAAAFAMSTSLAAQAPSPQERRIEGGWVRTDTAGSGSFGGLGASLPQAQLTPEAAARGGGAARGAGPNVGRGGAPPSSRPNPVGVPYIVVEQPCGANPGRGNGALLLNPDSGGVHIVESKAEVIFAGERGGVRHIYIDGRPHPAPGTWTPTPAGHSVGRYEGNALLVDTVGMTPGGVPGGGQRTAETHLRERFEVSPDGRKLTITYTWDDPKIYRSPHTYAYVFDRVPNAYAFEDWCDASDPIEKQSIVPPPQR